MVISVSPGLIEVIDDEATFAAAKIGGNTRGEELSEM